MERMRKAAAVAMVALAGALMMGGCTSDSDTGAVEPSGTPAAEAIVGTWSHENEDGYTTVEYLDDGTWAAYDADTVDTSGTPKDFGEYAVEGDTLTLGPDDYCGERLGTYTLTFTGDQMELTLVSDDCTIRQADIVEKTPMTRVTE